jgi:8-oxo-dGTP diphosphatase
MHAMAWTARNSEGYVAPVALAADAVVLTVRGGVLLVLCVGRGDGELVVPGGFVGETETPLDTVRRKLLEKTGVRQGYFEQLGTFADHAAIVTAALERLEGKLWWSNVAVGVLPGAFTLSQARSVYAAIAGVEYDPATFARDLKATGLIEPTGEQRAEGPGRPAALFRFASADPSWGAGRRKRVAPA